MTTNAITLISAYQIAQQLSKQNSKDPVGTSIIVGKRKDLLMFCKPMWKNPLSDLHKVYRNINNTGIFYHIIKAAPRGGFLFVDWSGTVEMVAEYLPYTLWIPGLEDLDSRHRITAAITMMIDSIGIVVSEVDGKISVFRNGKRLEGLPWEIDYK